MFVGSKSNESLKNTKFALARLIKFLEGSHGNTICGEKNVTLNFHKLVHLPGEAFEFNVLPIFSGFPFLESFTEGHVHRVFWMV